MTIYEINDKAKEYFDNLPVEKLMTQVEKDALRVNFMDRVFKLLPMTVEKGHLIFDEPEPQIQQYLEGGANERHPRYVKKQEGDNFVMSHQAWQQRKDSFEPLFVGEWKEQTRVTEKMTVYINDMEWDVIVDGKFTIAESLHTGLHLNPRHPLVPDNWDKVMKI